MGPNSIRTPQQDRSRAKAEAILVAARKLIAAHGAAALKVQDIATEAKVSLSSIYQYYENKDAVLAALAISYFEDVKTLMMSFLPMPVDSKEDAIKVTDTLLAAFLDLGRKDPVMRQVLVAIKLHQDLRELDYKNCVEITDFLYQSTQHCFAEQSRPELRRRIEILATASAAVLDLLSHKDEAEQKELVTSTREVFRATLLALD